MGREKDIPVDLVVDFRRMPSTDDEIDTLIASVYELDAIREDFLRHKGHHHSDDYDRIHSLEIVVDIPKKDVNNEEVLKSLIFGNGDIKWNVVYRSPDKYGDYLVYLGNYADSMIYCIPGSGRFEEVPLTDVDAHDSVLDNLCIKMNMIGQGSLVKFNGNLYGGADVLGKIDNKYKVNLYHGNKVKADNLEHILKMEDITLRNIKNPSLNVMLPYYVKWYNCKTKIPFIYMLKNNITSKTSLDVGAAISLSFDKIRDSTLNIDKLHSGFVVLGDMIQSNVKCNEFNSFDIREDTNKCNICLGGSETSRVEFNNIFESKVEIKKCGALEIEGSVEKSVISIGKTGRMILGNELEDCVIHLNKCKKVHYSSKSSIRNVTIYASEECREALKPLEGIDGINIKFNG